MKPAKSILHMLTLSPRLGSRWLPIIPMLLLGVAAGHGQGALLDFSILTPAAEAWDADDILLPDGSDVLLPASSLGLNGNTNVDAFTFGYDRITPLAAYYFARVGYSVERGSSGNGGIVTVQNLGNGVGGDKLQVVVVGFGGFIFPIFPPRLISDAPYHRITPAPNETELDGLSSRPPGYTNYPVYFSVGPGQAWDPADILIVTNATTRAEVFASASQLGLVPGDDIDALAIGKVPGEPAPLTLTAGVTIWVSLTRTSPTASLVLTNGDGVLQVYPGPVQVAIDAVSLDLSPTDELDALSGFDPGQSVSIHTSALMGPAGQVTGIPLSSNSILGSTFYIKEPTFVKYIGGHLLGVWGRVFGAIVSLSGPGAMPATPPFDAASAAVHVEFEPPAASMDLKIPVFAHLNPGHYAVLFGGGSFGATGFAYMPLTNQAVTDSIVRWNGKAWSAFSPGNLRFTVEGTPLRIDSALAGNVLTLTWDFPGYLLESSTTVEGSYALVPGATSPWQVRVNSTGATFYRLRSEPPPPVHGAGMPLLLSLLESRQSQFSNGELIEPLQLAVALDGAIREGSAETSLGLLQTLFSSLDTLPPGVAAVRVALDATLAIEHDLKGQPASAPKIEADHFWNMTCTGAPDFNCVVERGRYCRQLKYKGQVVGCASGKMPN